MTRSALSSRLAERHAQLTTKDIDLAVNAILEAQCNTLVKSARIGIRGFGSFDLNHRTPRQGRNSTTRETVFVPAKRAPHFTAGKGLPTRADSKHQISLHQPSGRHIEIVSRAHATGV
jgi:integration host factor subunit beta